MYNNDSSFCKLLSKTGLALKKGGKQNILRKYTVEVGWLFSSHFMCELIFIVFRNQCDRIG